MKSISNLNEQEETLDIGTNYILHKNKILGKGAFGKLYLGKFFRKIKITKATTY